MSRTCGDTLYILQKNHQLHQQSQRAHLYHLDLPYDGAYKQA